MNARVKLAGGGALAALLVLALLGGTASPGFTIAGAPGVVAEAVVRALRPARAAPATPPGAPGIPPGPTIKASAYAVGDIPAAYLALYVTAAAACPTLTWQVLAGIGKVESNHGRSTAPWDTYGDGTPTHVYDPHYAIPAAAHLLCANGLATPHPPPDDPCPTVTGTPAQHHAIKRYNNACWYVHQVLTLATRYTTTPTPAPATDPFVVALAHHPHLHTTRSGGCNPAPDLASGNLDLRVTSLLTVLADHWQLRISCVHTGHSTYVHGTHRISNHTVWRAVDIDQVNGQPVSPHSPTAHALVAWLDHLQGPLRPTEVGSPFPLGHRPYFTDDGHTNHIHIGYSAM